MRLAFAQIARRANRINTGLRLLSPLIQAESEGLPGPTASEAAEYAVLLQRAGSVTEALTRLSKIDPREAPETLLYRAFCHFTRWDYGTARPLLEAYVAHSGLSDYQRFIGRVNLAAVHVTLQATDEAGELLKSLLEESARRSYTRLHSNALELSAQVSIQRGEWRRAERDLDEAANLLSAGTGSLDSLFVRKWKSIATSLETGDPGPLKSFRAEALSARHWESVREADLYLLRAEPNESAFQRLWAGTPYPEYRERIVAAAHDRWALPSHYSIGTGNRHLDLTLGEENGVALFGSAKRPHALLLALFSDFYRPRRLGTLFADLFPDERYDVEGSPNRVHQILLRTREILSDRELPLRLSESDGDYHFELGAGLRVELPLTPAPEHPQDVTIVKLERHYADREFSAKEARESLGVPMTSFGRVLDVALKTGRLEKVGAGPRTRYRFVKDLKKSA